MDHPGRRPKNEESEKRGRYLCERCGGTGYQMNGCWDWVAQSYTSPEGTCRLCDGEGYLVRITTKGEENEH